MRHNSHWLSMSAFLKQDLKQQHIPWKVKAPAPVKAHVPRHSIVLLSFSLCLLRKLLQAAWGLPGAL